MQNGHFMKFTYEILCKSNHSRKSFWFFEDNIVFSLLNTFYEFFPLSYTFWHYCIFWSLFFMAFLFICEHLFTNICSRFWWELRISDTWHKKYDHFFICEALEIHWPISIHFGLFVYGKRIFMDINVINKKELLLHSQVICCKWPLNIFVTIIITTLIFSLQVLTRNTQFSYSPKNVSTFYDYLLRKSNLRFCLELQKSSFGSEKPIQPGNVIFP